jgi:hypothetical protein
LEIGNGGYDGTRAGTSLSDFFGQDERGTVITATQLLLGTDLTQNPDPVDQQNHFDYSLLQNDEVLAVDQAGVPGAPINDYLVTDSDQKNGSLPEIWRSKQPDGTYAILVTNLAERYCELEHLWLQWRRDYS